MIKTWQQRCEEHPDHQQGIVTQQMIQDRMQEEIDELRQALAQPEHTAWVTAGEHTVPLKVSAPVDAVNMNQERVDETVKNRHELVAWITDGGKGDLGWRKTTEKDIPLYTAPPKREWVGLTDEEIEEHFFNNVNTGSLLSFGAGAAYAEAKLKEKNGGQTL